MAAADLLTIAHGRISHLIDEIGEGGTALSEASIQIAVLMALEAIITELMERRTDDH